MIERGPGGRVAELHEVRPSNELKYFENFPPADDCRTLRFTLITPNLSSRSKKWGSIAKLID